MSEHYCKEHEAVFFKKGKMKGYAHPIEGTEPVEWCNEMSADALPPPQEPQVLPQHQKVIDKAIGEGFKHDAVNPIPVEKTIAPQAIGMITKELGDMIRAKYLNAIFGDEAQVELIKWYRGQVLGITRINYDGAKLPNLGANKTTEPPFIEPDDIPF